MVNINSLKASDGTGNAAVATIQSVRAPLATTIVVDTVENINSVFHGTMGTPHTFVDPVTSETITVISEATAVDFQGHVDGGNLEIDTIAPGYTDGGSQVNDIVIIKPTSQWADELVKWGTVEHNQDGTHSDVTATSTVTTDLTVTNAPTFTVGGALYKESHYYTYDGTDIFVDGVDQNNAANTINWTKPTGLKFVVVEVQGGGGGGGGVANTIAAPNAAGSSGGGAGGYSRKKILAASLGATETVTVGALGAGGTAGANNGSAGGTTSFGSHCSATGGAGGTGGTASNNNAVAATSAAGGVGSGGDLNLLGDSSKTGIRFGEVNHAVGSAGGSSVYGAGGQEVNHSNAGSAATGYGSGGSGAANGASQSARAGGNGAAGIVIVHEYL